MEAAVARVLLKNPRLAAHAAHVAPRNDYTARDGVVALAAVVRRDALARVNAICWFLRSV